MGNILAIRVDDLEFVVMQTLLIENGEPLFVTRFPNGEEILLRKAELDNPRELAQMFLQQTDPNRYAKMVEIRELKLKEPFPELVVAVPTKDALPERASVASPPKDAEFVVAIFAPFKVREQMLGDLEEAFFDNVERFGPKAAAWSYRYQVLRSAVWFIIPRLTGLAGIGALLKRISGQ